MFGWKRIERISLIKPIDQPELTEARTFLEELESKLEAIAHTRACAILGRCNSYEEYNERLARSDFSNIDEDDITIMFLDYLMDFYTSAVRKQIHNVNRLEYADSNVLKVHVTSLANLYKTFICYHEAEQQTAARREDCDEQINPYTHDMLGGIDSSDEDTADEPELCAAEHHETSEKCAELDLDETQQNTRWQNLSQITLDDILCHYLEPSEPQVRKAAVEHVDSIVAEKKNSYHSPVYWPPLVIRSYSILPDVASSTMSR